MRPRSAPKRLSRRRRIRGRRLHARLHPITGKRRLLPSPVSVRCIVLVTKRVALLRVWVGAEAVTQVERGQHPDRDLRGQRNPARQVEHRDAERRPDHQGQHLESQQAVQLQRARQPPAATQEQRSLLTADGDDRDDRHVVLERELDESRSPAEPHLAGLPRRPVGLVVAAGVDEQRRVSEQCPLHVLGRCRDRSVLLHEGSRPWDLEDQIVRELMKPPVRPEVVIEGLGEDERVGDHRSAGVIADQ